MLYGLRSLPRGIALDRFESLCDAGIFSFYVCFQARRLVYSRNRSIDFCRGGAAFRRGARRCAIYKALGVLCCALYLRGCDGRAWRERQFRRRVRIYAALASDHRSTLCRRRISNTISAHRRPPSSRFIRQVDAIPSRRLERDHLLSSIRPEPTPLQPTERRNLACLASCANRDFWLTVGALHFSTLRALREAW